MTTTDELLSAGLFADDGPADPDRSWSARDSGDGAEDVDDPTDACTRAVAELEARGPFLPRDVDLDDEDFRPEEDGAYETEESYQAFRKLCARIGLKL